MERLHTLAGLYTLVIAVTEDWGNGLRSIRRVSLLIRTEKAIENESHDTNSIHIEIERIPMGLSIKALRMKPGACFQPGKTSVCPGDRRQ
jgi:hypothetical protein